MASAQILTNGKALYAYSGSVWYGLNTSGNLVNATRWQKVATGGETTLSGNDDTGEALSYTPGFEQVFLNGVLLARDLDYTATNGTTITGLTALTAGYIVEVIAYNNINVGNTYTQAQIDNKVANTFTRWVETLSASATVLSGLDDNSNTLSYTPGLEQVYVNGILLLPSEYTATSGSSVVLSEAAVSGDVIQVYTLKNFRVPNTYTIAQTDDQFLTKTSASSTYQSKALNQYPYRNLVINGAMQVAQRGTSVASITSDTYGATDRWRFLPLTQGTWTMSQENDAPTGSGFRKSTKVLCTTADASPAAGDYVRLDQRIEGQNLQQVKKGTAAAEQLTLSFWVKSNVTGTYIARFYENDNNRNVSKSYTINSSGVWEYKTITFPADTTGPLDNDNEASLILIFMLGAGTDFTSGTLATTWQSYTAANVAPGQVNVASATNNYWQITGVQLEVGNIATPFEFKTFAQDLLECQRYYHRWTADESYAQFANGMTWSSTQSRFTIQMPTTMRSVPVLTSGSLGTKSSNGSIQAVTSLTLESSSSSKHAIGTLANVAAGLTANYPALLQANNNTSAYIAVEAEL